MNAYYLLQSTLGNPPLDQVPALRPAPFLETGIKHPDSVDKPSIVARGRHYYSPKIAKQINPKQPDVVAAAILYNLSLWQKNSYSQTFIDDRRYSFRSLSELNGDMPYLSESAIHKALQRLEKALGSNFLIRRDRSKLWFSIGSSVIKIMRGKRGEKALLHSFLVDDALKAGCIKSAVILSNLKYALSHFRKPLLDEQMRMYAELNPLKLSPILGCSCDTISRLLTKLRDRRLLSQHSSRKHFYRLPDDAENAFLGKAKVDTNPADVHTYAANVHNQTIPKCTLSADNEGVRDDQKVAYSNIDRKEDSKGNIILASAELREKPDIDSPGLRMLSDLADQRLAEFRSMSAVNLGANATLFIPNGDNGESPVQLNKQCPDLPYEHYEPSSAQFEMPYDEGLEEILPFREWVKNQVDQMLMVCLINGETATDELVSTLRRFFWDNPEISADDLHELYSKRYIECLVIGGSIEVSRGYDDQLFLKKCQTVKLFMRYLRQFIYQVYFERNEIDGETYYIGEVKAPFNDIDFSYLGDVPASSICSYIRPVPTITVDDDHEEVIKALGGAPCF